MSEQKLSKVNHLVSLLGDGDVVSARWLAAHGYSTSLVSRYVKSGWLKAPARGVYSLANTEARWEGVVHNLQQRELLRVHVGGRFALSWRGHEHYLQLGEFAVVTLHTADRLPGWAMRLPLQHPLRDCGRGPFDVSPVLLNDEASDRQLNDLGLVRLEVSSRGSVVMASPERAMLELCDGKPGAALAYEADAVMQGLAGLRPEWVGALLRQCRSVKAKRLFLALAERYEHAWLARVDLHEVDLGRGKRAFVPGGRLHPKYLLTLPADLGEQLG